MGAEPVWAEALCVSQSILRKTCIGLSPDLNIGMVVSGTEESSLRCVVHRMSLGKLEGTRNEC